MKTILTIGTFLLSALFLFSQEHPFNDYTFQQSIGYEINSDDIAMLRNIPLLPIPENYGNDDLPAVVDNSTKKYFRPIFSQQSFPNCMQSTSIAYNFTYEINRLRDLSADLPENQYVTHFAWNFYNGGHGWFGVNYLHTFDVLKACGTPSSQTYGGFYAGGGERWMTGYDNYLSAMENRIDGIYAIPVDTEEGILALKQWIYDHHEGAEAGGVASFIACSPWSLSRLPEGTPEENKYVIAQWCDMALHGMTIIGYNDSIRYDYNGDGKYTNDVDINMDGKLNVRDWEIGGFKFANSYDTNWADQGFSYMMYKTLADPLSLGGIWGNVVHVVKPIENYMPDVTLKVELKHNSREMIRVRAGVSYDTNMAFPAMIKEFPIFNYQGGNNYMQGNDSLESNQFIEFGLDVTPLLSYIEPGEFANFFLMVDENDDKNLGMGEIVSFSLINHLDGNSEIICQETNVPLNNNYTTILSIPATIDFDKPEITTAQVPAFIPGIAYEYQLQAGGGLPPYKWQLERNYFESYDQEEFPDYPANQIFPNTQNDTVFEIPLGFEFPFYGEVYDTIYASAFGFLYFDEGIDYWPYTWKQKEFFKDIKCIAPLKSKSLAAFPDLNDGLWYESNNQEAIFVWDNSTREKPYSSDLIFALKIHKSGEIEFYYGDIRFEVEMEWAGGISEGNAMNYQFVDYDDPRDIAMNSKVVFSQKDYPPVYEINEDGVLELFSEDEHISYDLDVLLTDKKGISAKKSLFFADDLIVDIQFHDNNDTIIEYGETLWGDLILRNISSASISNLSIINEIDDPYIEILDDSHSISTISPGQMKFIENAFRYKVSHEIPDSYTICFEIRATDESISWERNINKNIKAPKLVSKNIEIVDGDNQRLDSGESCQLKLFLQNNGHASTGNMYVKLLPLDPYIEVHGLPGVEMGPVDPGKSIPLYFDITADANIPNGYFIELEVEMNDQKGVTTRDTIKIMVGRMPVLILDLDPNNLSGPSLRKSLEDLGVPYQYNMGFPENDLSENQLVFLCLGKLFANHVLSWQQGSLLSDFLSDGGNLYMEGMVTWQDEWTPVHGMFSLGIVEQPSMFENIKGADSTFAEGMEFANTADPAFAFYYLNPSPPAYTLFTDTVNHYPCGVAYETSDYKTIASIFEFGSLVDSSFSKTDLMSKLLDFFEVQYSIASINNPVTDMGIDEVICYPNPFTQNSTISFSLSESALVDLKIYNIHGQLVGHVLSSEKLPCGDHELSWKVPSGLPGGLYFFTLSDGKGFVTGKMIHTK